MPNGKGTNVLFQQLQIPQFSPEPELRPGRNRDVLCLGKVIFTQRKPVMETELMEKTGKRIDYSWTGKAKPDAGRGLAQPGQSPRLSPGQPSGTAPGVRQPQVATKSGAGTARGLADGKSARTLQMKGLGLLRWDSVSVPLNSASTAGDHPSGSGIRVVYHQLITAVRDRQLKPALLSGRMKKYICSLLFLIQYFCLHLSKPT